MPVQARIVGLTIDPNVLLSIRRNRIGMMGAKDFSVPLNYAGMQVCGSSCVCEASVERNCVTANSVHLLLTANRNQAMEV